MVKRKLDWTAPLRPTNARTQGFQLIGKQAVKDGKPITDGFDILILAGKNHRPWYLNEYGEGLSHQSGEIVTVVEQDVPDEEDESAYATSAPANEATRQYLARMEDLEKKATETQAYVLEISGWVEQLTDDPTLQKTRKEIHDLDAKNKLVLADLSKEMQSISSTVPSKMAVLEKLTVGIAQSLDRFLETQTAQNKRLESQISELNATTNMLLSELGRLEADVPKPEGERPVTPAVPATVALQPATPAYDKPKARLSNLSDLKTISKH